jgi:hypothetical protein
MSEILIETTVWNTDYKVPNNTYLLNSKGEILAFINELTGKLTVSKTPIKLDKRYRKFQKTSHPELEKISKLQKKEGRSFEVKSKDNVYIVNLSNKKYNCTCTGYNFRGHCKHIDAVKSKLEK